MHGIYNLKASEIELRQRLPTPERDWLVGALRARPGIAGATCASDARHLTIQYDGDRLVSDDLVAFLNQCGVWVVRVHVGHG